MRVEIIGYEKIDFTTNEGNKIKGTNIYYLEKCNLTGSGLKGNKKFISSDICNNFSIGQADVEVNLSGKVSGVTFVK